MRYRNPASVRILERLIRARLRLPTRAWRVLLGVDMGDVWPEGMILPHPFGVVLHAGAVIGRDCVFYQGVTLGADIDGPGAPVLGDRVRVFANASIIGHVSVGSDAVIGANSVVVRDVDPGTVVAGVPARFIRRVTQDEMLSSGSEE